MRRKGRKHKKGERGSIEEDTATSKRANMAATQGQDEDELPITHQPTEELHKPEPTLLELHEMLVGIQINANNIPRGNKELHSEMEELKSTVKRQTIEISTLKTQLQKIK